MRVVIIGGTGHVGTYLVPRLVGAGHEVICVSRQQRAPYQTNEAWNQVRMITLDRLELESKGTFGKAIAQLDPEVVIDMICFNTDSARQLTEALHGRIGHFLHCGTLWVHGYSTEVPTDEMQPRYPFGDYGIAKAAIEAYRSLSFATGSGAPFSRYHTSPRPYRRTWMAAHQSSGQSQSGGL